MYLPLNGRIAIIDDKINQAIPLMNTLSKLRCPYTYYSGEVEYLPEEGQEPNDIRLLFLDINLLDNRKYDDKVIKGSLISILKRIISPSNYPYVLIYWSRNEDEYKQMVEGIFSNELSDRKPIAYLSQNKLSYFNLDDSKTENHEEEIKKLLTRVTDILNEHPAYSYLINWENHLHDAADQTLQEIFQSCHTSENWLHNAGYLIENLGISYTGKKSYTKLSADEKIKNSFQAFNYLFYDTLEFLINTSENKNNKEILYEKSLAIKETIYTINKKLLLYETKSNLNYPGLVFEDNDNESEKKYKEVLNNCCNRKVIENEIINSEENKDKSPNELKKLLDKEASKIRDNIRQSWKKINLVVTPLCDFVQDKCDYVRVVKGLLIKKDFIKYIDNKSEAIFISPQFRHNEDNYVIVLHFRYFYTTADLNNITTNHPLFRIRQQLLSEVQSKLARHISRQGVLFIDED